ncbi:MAG: hypothetical protein D6767_09860 [Candidatus Hydrogenedentota bacterium]|nr:MAG: hypothetical protein D6767_09860 [Candidatus Hydrogenedentota bacterium]
MKNGIKFLFFIVVVESLWTIPFQFVLSGLHATRFRDTYDRRWENIRLNATDSAADVVETRTYLRNFFGGTAKILMSPFYKHFFGIRGGYNISLSSAQLQDKAGSVTRLSTQDFSFYYVGIAYQFFPWLESKSLAKHLYIGTSLSYAKAKSTLSIQYTDGSNVSYQFDNISGFGGSLRGGMLIPFSKLFFVDIAVGVSSFYFSELQGSANGESISLMSDGSILVPVPFSQSSSLPNFEKIPLWNTGIFFQVGVGLRL